jgi:hypothetical protein
MTPTGAQMYIDMLRIKNEISQINREATQNPNDPQVMAKRNNIQHLDARLLDLQDKFQLYKVGSVKDQGYLERKELEKQKNKVQVAFASAGKGSFMQYK